MKRTLIPFHNITQNDFVIMVALVESIEPLKIREVETSVHFESIDDMRRFYDLLGKMINDWDDKEKTNEINRANQTES